MKAAIPLLLALLVLTLESCKLGPQPLDPGPDGAHGPPSTSGGGEVPPGVDQEKGTTVPHACECTCEQEGCGCKPLRGGGCVCGDRDFLDCECTCVGQEVIPITSITPEFMQERKQAPEN